MAKMTHVSYKDLSNTLKNKVDSGEIGFCKACDMHIAAMTEAEKEKSIVDYKREDFSSHKLWEVRANRYDRR